MTQGKEKTRPTEDLSYIFYKIRETRDSKVRRSWQRRARLALQKRTDLTPAERHEVCTVWSKSDCNRIDSPALSKCLGRAHIHFEGTRPASSVIRKRFDANGQPLQKSAPSECTQHMPQRLPRLDTRVCSVARSYSIRARSRRVPFVLHTCAQGDSDSRALHDGSRSNPSRRREQKRLKPSALKLQKERLIENLFSRLKIPF